MRDFAPREYIPDECPQYCPECSDQLTDDHVPSCRRCWRCEECGCVCKSGLPKYAYILWSDGVAWCCPLNEERMKEAVTRHKEVLPKTPFRVEVIDNQTGQSIWLEGELI